MGDVNIISVLALIFAGSALLGTFFNWIRQPIIISYIAFGMIAGPRGLGLVSEPGYIEEISHFGIILLLFLLGLDLEPRKLLALFGRTSAVALATGTVFASAGAGFFLLFGYGAAESLIAGAALMFSSTVISVKLISVNVLHHKRMGEMMISILLMQDIMAIILILGIKGGGAGFLMSPFVLIAKTAALWGVSFLIVRYVISGLIRRFDKVHEYVFILFLGWCLSVAAAASFMSLSWEIGAFVAGVSLASSPVALYVVDRLKPLRNFFLVLFFFSIGARYDFLLTAGVVVPGILLSLLFLAGKPFIYAKCFRAVGETKNFSRELALRLGQCSEFALLVSYAAETSGAMSARLSGIVQFITITTFIISTWLVVGRYRTPINAL